MNIAVFPSEALTAHSRLFSGLSELSGAVFVPGRQSDVQGIDAVILFDTTRSAALSWAGRGLRCLGYVSHSPVAVSHSTVVQLSAASALPQCLRSAAEVDAHITMVCEVPPERDDDRVIASQDGRVLWLRCEQPGTAVADLVGVAPPVLGASEYLFEHFHQHRWLSLLPLLEFVREVSGWVAPPHRACFMFDDPNLHWLRYGHVDYKEIARDAAARNYHVSFATVPLDSWYVNSATARFFRQNASRLSLLIHGNNHTRSELHGKWTDGAAAALSAQALARVAAMERRAGISVARVMAAPHGACSYAMATAMARTGFESACISRGSLMERNPEISWPVSTGMHPALIFGDELPVLPRMSLHARSSWAIRLALYLGQPVIPIGHHGDLRQGHETLHWWVEAVDACGPVTWADMTTISRSNFQIRRRGRTLGVNMYSRRAVIRIPDDVDHAEVQPAWVSKSASPRLRVTLSAAGELRRSEIVVAGERVGVQPGVTIEMEAIHPAELDPLGLAVPPTPLRVLARRYLCEARDRLRPTVDRLRSGASQS